MPTRRPLFSDQPTQPMFGADSTFAPQQDRASTITRVQPGQPNANTPNVNNPAPPLVGPGGTPTIGPTASPMPPNHVVDPSIINAPLHATTAPTSYASAPPDPRVAQMIDEFLNQSGLPANQSDPSSLEAIVNHLRSQGVNAQVDYTDENGHTGGILVNGQPYQLIDGSNNWTPLQPWAESGGGGAGAGGGGGAGTGGGLSKILDDALATLIGRNGGTPVTGNIMDMLTSIIKGGHAPDMSNRLVAGREAEAAGMKAQIADAGGYLADRGLISEPGIQQGAESSMITDLTERMATPYSQAISDIEQHGMDLDNTTINNALGLATGLSQSEAQNLLSALGTGSQREIGLAQIALNQLQSDRDWQKFLSEFGLTHDQVMEQLRQGRVSQVIQLAQLFGQGALTSAGGYIR